MNSRLNRNFHCTFFPKRRYIHSLLKYAASNGSCSISAINEATDIPTGKYSGQVAPTLDYCKAFQLVEVLNKKVSLTLLGEIVLKQDAFITEELTQWFLHFNICNENTGANIWYQIFNSGAFILGEKFSKDELLKFLNNEFKTDMRRSLNPLLSMYLNPDSFATCRAIIKKEKSMYRRTKAPVKREMVFMYGAWFLQNIEKYFSNLNQISEDQFAASLNMKKLTYWGDKDKEAVYQYMEEKNIISVDRHMRPWLITPLIRYDKAVENLYTLLI